MFVEPSKHGHQICLNAQMRTPILHLWTSETFLKSASQRHHVVISTAYSRNMLDQLNLSKRCMSDCQVFLLLLDSAASMFKIWHLVCLRLLYINILPVYCHQENLFCFFFLFIKIWRWQMVQKYLQVMKIWFLWKSWYLFANYAAGTAPYI